MIGLDMTTMHAAIKRCSKGSAVGVLHSARGVLTARLPAAVSSLCHIETKDRLTALAEVIGFDGDVVQLMSFDAQTVFSPGDSVMALGRPLDVPVGIALLGRVVDGLGNPIDGKGPLTAVMRRSLAMNSVSPMTRRRVSRPFVTGQRVIDGLLTFGVGQRVGLFAGSGVGKSTLLGEVAKHSQSDLNVIALIGERGREVRPFIEDCLGEAGLKKSVVFVATADDSPLLRVRTAQAAVAVADYFRGRGADVLLMLDSVTRMAMAQREIGLQLGEPPTSRGYTPSVFQFLARILEQLGNSNKGSITGLITVLVDGDDMNEPIADSVRSIVDGHIVLSRKLADRSHFPAIDVASSLSRVFRDVSSPEVQDAARCIRSILATHEEVEDLIRVGAYVSGSSPSVDQALQMLPDVNRFVCQSLGETSLLADTVTQLSSIAARWTS